MPGRDLQNDWRAGDSRGRRRHACPGCRAGAKGCREGVDDATHSGRQARPSGQLERCHADATGAAGEPGRHPHQGTGRRRWRIARSRCASSATRRAIRDRPTPPVRGGEDRPLPPGEPTFIERISAAAGGKVGGYNNFWLDPGEHVLRGRRPPSQLHRRRPPDGRVPALTPEARQRAAERGAAAGNSVQFDHPELRRPAERCLMSFGSNAGPPMLPNYFYNNNYTDRADQRPRDDHDRDGARRARHPADRRRASTEGACANGSGDSIGRWEGDTLVVETTNFHPLQVFRGASENLKVIERFARTDPTQSSTGSRSTIPRTCVSQWSGQIPFNRMDDLIYEYALSRGELRPRQRAQR